MSSLCLAFGTSRFQGFWPLLGSCRLKASRFLASLVAIASSRLQGFWPSLGRWKLKVSRFLAFSWPLQAQGFKVSGLAQAFTSSRFQALFGPFCKLAEVSRLLSWPWVNLQACLQTQSFKGFKLGHQNCSAPREILRLRACTPPFERSEKIYCCNEFV